MLRGAVAQHLGGRDQQQDSVFSEPGLHVVADGNGLLGACSAKAIDLFRQHLQATASLPTAVRQTDDDLCAYLRTQVAEALEGFRVENPQQLEMLGPELLEGELSSGTTLVAFVRDTHLVHVGDSRAYRITPATRELVLLTRDHVWTRDAETVDLDGTLYKHGLAMQRVLGHPLLRKHGVTPEPDIAPFKLAYGDLLLLCSDGLVPFLEDPARLFELVARPLDEAAAAIIEAAAPDAGDNVSLVLVGR